MKVADYADKAEIKGEHPMLAKTNSMQKKAKEKQQELDNICQQLQEKSRYSKPTSRLCSQQCDWPTCALFYHYPFASCALLFNKTVYL